MASARRRVQRTKVRLFTHQILAAKSNLTLMELKRKVPIKTPNRLSGYWKIFHHRLTPLRERGRRARLCHMIYRN